MSAMAEVSLLNDLQSELSKIGIASERDFKLPGSDLVIDLFVPSLPRAAVEIKNFRSPQQFLRGVERLQELRTLGKQELGLAFVPIFLVYRPPTIAPVQWPAMPRGVEAIVLDSDPNDAGVTAIAASRIGAILDKHRKKLLVRSAPILGGLLPVLGITAIPGVLALTGLIPAKQGRTEFPRTSEPTTPPSDQGPLGASSESLSVIAAQVRCILDTFHDLAPEAYLVAEHEMRFLIEEFRSGHFTACAMRGGRCLESMVYELSRRWDIELRDATFGKLDDVRKSLDRVGELLGDYESETSTHRETVRLKLDKALVEFSSRATEAILAVKDQQGNATEAARSDGGPRPIIALLKRVRNRYGRLAGVVDSLRDLLEVPSRPKLRTPIERIIEIRNRAAHAHLDGKPQEIDETTVKQLLDDINFVMLRLSNVGISIQTNRKGT